MTPRKRGAETFGSDRDRSCSDLPFSSLTFAAPASNVHSSTCQQSARRRRSPVTSPQPQNRRLRQSFRQNLKVMQERRLRPKMRSQISCQLVLRRESYGLDRTSPGRVSRPDDIISACDLTARYRSEFIDKMLELGSKFLRGIDRVYFFLWGYHSWCA
jgi:hypothetical protein